LEKQNKKVHDKENITLTTPKVAVELWASVSITSNGDIKLSLSMSNDRVKGNNIEV